MQSLFRHRTFFSQLMVTQLLTVLIALLAIGTIFGYLLQRYFSGVREWELQAEGERIVQVLQDRLSEGKQISGDPDLLDALSLAPDIDLWVTDGLGRVMFETVSAEDDTNVTLDPPEAVYVEAGNAVTKKVAGPDVQNLLVVLPILEVPPEQGGLLAAQSGSDDEPGARPVVGSVALRAPLGGPVATVNNVLKLVLYSAIVAVIAAGFFGLSLSRTMSRPLEQLKRAAADIVRGRFTTIEPPANGSDEVLQLVGAFNQASYTVEQTLQKQAELDRVRREFVANVSHELRAPLTSLRGFLELMEHSSIDDTEREAYRRIMLDDTLYLQRLVQDLTDLTRMESGDVALRRGKIKPAKMLTRARDTMSNRAAEKSIRLDVAAAPDLPPVLADADRIHQVLINYVDNALRHMPEGETITLRAERASRAVRFEVVDRGPGIPETERSRVWDRFYKIDKARSRRGGSEGSGLGLAVAKEIVTRHGGEVYVRENPQGGSVFGFTLPAT